MTPGMIIAKFFGGRFHMRNMAMFLSFVVCATLLSGCERYWLDRQMEELCKKDGGVKVYEKVMLPPAEYERVFNFVAAAKSKEERYGSGYRYVLKSDVVAGKGVDPDKGRGTLTRYYGALYRALDGRLLGENISYQRVGGDLFTFGFQPSGNHCPKPRIDLAQSIFVKGE